MAMDTLLDRLEGVKANGRDKWMAKCPSHSDRSPSLSIRGTSDGTILLHCFAGCGAVDVVAAVGLELRDLFPEPLGHHRPARKRQRIPPRQMLEAVSQALTTIKLVDAKACDFIPMSDEERDAVDNALAVLAEAEREVA